MKLLISLLSASCLSCLSGTFADKTIQFKQCKRTCANYDPNKAMICQPALTLKSAYKACLKGSTAAFHHSCIPSCMEETVEEAGNSYQACENYWKKSRTNNELSYCRFGYDRTYEKVTQDFSLAKEEQQNVDLVKKQEERILWKRNLMKEEDNLEVDTKQNPAKDNGSIQDTAVREEAEDSNSLESLDIEEEEYVVVVEQEKNTKVEEIANAKDKRDEKFEVIKDTTVHEEEDEDSESQDAAGEDDAFHQKEKTKAAEIPNVKDIRDEYFEEIEDATTREVNEEFNSLVSKDALHQEEKTKVETITHVNNDERDKEFEEIEGTTIGNTPEKEIESRQDELLEIEKISDVDHVEMMPEIYS